MSVDWSEKMVFSIACNNTAILPQVQLHRRKLQYSEITGENETSRAFTTKA